MGKYKDMSHKERAVFLANQLIKELQSTGVDCRASTAPDGFAYIQLNIHSYNKAGSKIDIEGGYSDKRISGKQTVKIKAIKD